MTFKSQKNISGKIDGKKIIPLLLKNPSIVIFT